jgi:hypothetical protein
MENLQGNFILQKKELERYLKKLLELISGTKDHN